MKKLEFLAKLGDGMKYWRDNKVIVSFNNQGSSFLKTDYWIQLDTKVETALHKVKKRDLYGLVFGIIHTVRHLHDNTDIANGTRAKLGTSEESVYNYYATRFPRVFMVV